MHLPCADVSDVSRAQHRQVSVCAVALRDTPGH